VYIFYYEFNNKYYLFFRLHSLETSCDTLPTSLVLIKNGENNYKDVVGHSKITPIPSMPDSVFVESGKQNVHFFKELLK